MKPSIFNLGNAFNYMRLGYQSMARDQRERDEGAKAIAALEDLGKVARIEAVALLAVERARRLNDGMS